MHGDADWGMRHPMPKASPISGGMYKAIVLTWGGIGVGWRREGEPAPGFRNSQLQAKAIGAPAPGFRLPGS